eukprot:10968254-Alexandrium_andersonii.AAC.1
MAHAGRPLRRGPLPASDVPGCLVHPLEACLEDGREEDREGVAWDEEAALTPWAWHPATRCASCGPGPHRRRVGRSADPE